MRNTEKRKSKTENPMRNIEKRMSKTEDPVGNASDVLLGN